MYKCVVGVSLMLKEGICALLSPVLAPKLVSAIGKDLVLNLTGSAGN